MTNSSAFNVWLKREIVINLTVGGNRAAVLRHQTLCGADINIHIDCENEVQQHIASAKRYNVKTLSVGKGETARTLAKAAHSAVRRRAEEHAPIDATRGMGQDREIGHFASVHLLSRAQVKEFLEHELPELLRRLTGGVVEVVRIVGKASVAGGTGSPGLRLFVNALEEAILTCSDATTIHTELQICGGISYSGLGRRVHLNASAGTIEVFAYVTSKDHNDRVVRHLRLSELPPVGEDREARDRFMLECEQATQCPEVQAILAQLEPNAGMNGPFGNVWLLRSAHFQALHPRFDVGHDVAPAYARTLQDLLRHCKPQPALIRELVVTSHDVELPREDLEGLIARANTSDANDTIALITQQAVRTVGRVDAHLASGHSICLSEAPTVWAISPSTVAETRERLTLQNTCLQLLDLEISRMAASQDEADRRITGIARQLARTIASHQRPGVVAGLLAWIISPRPLSVRILPLARDLRNLTDRRHQYATKRHILEKTRSLVAAERDFVANRLSQMSTRMESAIPRGHQGECRPVVVPKHIDAVYRDLWACGNTPDESELSRILVSAVDHVTEFGLAKITAADPQRLEAVADQIIHMRGTLTPPYGGKDRDLNAWRIHVLPPVSRETGEKLKELIRAQGCDTPVVIAENMPASLNCTTLIYSPVFNLRDDILTTLLWNSLRKAYHPSVRHIYFPGDTANAPNQLGLDLNQDLPTTSPSTEGDQI